MVVKTACASDRMRPVGSSASAFASVLPQVSTAQGAEPVPVPWAEKGSAIVMLETLGPTAKLPDVQAANRALGFRPRDATKYSMGRLQRAAAWERGEPASPPTGAGKESAHVPRVSKKGGKQLTFDGSASSDASASQPTAASPQQSSIPIEEMPALLRSFADSQAVLDAPIIEVRAAATPSGDPERPVSLQLTRVTSPNAASPIASKALPRMQRPPLSEAQRLKVNDDVGALISVLHEHGYQLPPAELKLLETSRDDDGRVDCVLVVDGFPVHPENRWANVSGRGVCESMQPGIVQAAALGLVEEGAKAVFIDIHPRCDHWAAGGSLDKDLIAKMSRHALLEMPPCPTPLPTSLPIPLPTPATSPCSGRLIHAIPFAHEVIARGQHAVDGLRAAAVIEDVSGSYGLGKQRAFKTRLGQPQGENAARACKPPLHALCIHTRSAQRSAWHGRHRLLLSAHAELRRGVCDSHWQILQGQGDGPAGGPLRFCLARTRRQRSADWRKPLASGVHEA